MPCGEEWTAGIAYSMTTYSFASIHMWGDWTTKIISHPTHKLCFLFENGMSENDFEETRARFEESEVRVLFERAEVNPMGEEVAMRCFLPSQREHLGHPPVPKAVKAISSYLTFVVSHGFLELVLPYNSSECISRIGMLRGA
ncbi:hypothetical protein Patl1_36882 [Pistacia atlantica]|nr:hypothetical protein Patl1_36882 [Pistacia atlantica]